MAIVGAANSALCAVLAIAANASAADSGSDLAWVIEHMEVMALLRSFTDLL